MTHGEKLIYLDLDNLSKEEVLQTLTTGSFEQLAALPFIVGENYPDWKFAQTICVKLADNEHELIRANAIMGFGYIARTKGKLEKHIVKPLVLRELRQNIENKGQIIDAIGDINQFMGWKLASKH